MNTSFITVCMCADPLTVTVNNACQLIFKNSSTMAELTCNLSSFFLKKKVNQSYINWNIGCQVADYLLLTCPKLTAACWAEAVNTTTVRYSVSSSRVFRDLGNSVHKLWPDRIDKLSLNRSYTFFGNACNVEALVVKCRKLIATQWHCQTPEATCLPPQTSVYDRADMNL